jgi:hypothetical protein
MNLTGPTGVTGATGSASYTRTAFTASGGQTTFSVTYTPGAIEVFVNGVLLTSTDYTATNGTSVVLASPCSAGYIVEFIAIQIGSIAVGVTGYTGPSGPTGASGPTGGASYIRTSVTATEGQTTFTVSYTVGAIEVFVNGILLNASDYTATNGTSVILALGSAAGDIVEFIAITVGSVAVGVSGAIGATGPTGPTGTAAYNRTAYTATGGQTTFTVSYTVGALEVFVNGVLLNSADYTASNGTSVVLASACLLGDTVEFIAIQVGSISVGATGPSGGPQGPTGSTGASSTVTGPTGASLTGPTGPTGTGSYNRTAFTASAGQSTFVVNYTVGAIQVFVNGILLNSADYSATDGTSVVLASPCSAGYIVEFVAIAVGTVALGATGPTGAQSTVTGPTGVTPAITPIAAYKIGVY